MRMEDEPSKYVEEEQGVRNGCVFSQDLFNIYSKLILGEVEVLLGFITGKHNLNNE